MTSTTAPIAQDQATRDDARRPDLSAIVVTPDTYATVRRCIDHLRVQTTRDRIELVIVAPRLATLALDEAAVSVFPWLRLVEVGPITSVGHARAAGIRAATASVVANTEDHCFPAPDWAAAIIEAHQGPWVGVGPSFGNANPGIASWANMYVQHGPWIAPVEARVIDDLSGHNSSYKRDWLLAYGERLGTIMQAEPVMHRDLQARGGQLYLAPKVRADHINSTHPLTLVRENYWYARIFAGARAAAWPWPRRLVYAAGAPLIPLVRLPRVIRDIRRTGRGRLLPAMLPALLLVLGAGAVGEMVSYLVGPGESTAQMGPLEFNRGRFISRRDRQALGL